MSAITPFSPSRRKAYTVINTSTTPVWLAMILAPRSRLTRRLVARSNLLLVALGVSYDVLLSAGMVRNRKLIDFRDPDAVRAALTIPDAFLAGWAHYLAFDLFVGRWIWEDALAQGRQPRLALLLTWLAGPAGLTLHLAQRRNA
jgi:hypothetical protein